MNNSELEEYIKCRENPIYFLENYGKVRHPTKGLIDFALWDFQKECINAFVEHSYNIILKGRQLGISTLVAGYIAWLITFFANKEVYIVATKSSVATNLVSKIKVFLEELPEWLKPEQKTKNVQSVALANGSKAQASSTTKDAARSEALSLLVVDECAFVKNFRTIWTSAQPTLSTGGDCIILSTPNGANGWFYNQYIEAESGIQTQIGNKLQFFNPIRLSWKNHPDRNQAWADEMKAKIGEQAFAQEQDADFLMSGNSVFDPKSLIWYKESFDPFCEGQLYIRDPLYKKGIDNHLWVWKDPEFGKQYTISADVAKGDSSDFSAFHVIELEEYEQVAEYKGKIVPELFAQMLIEVGREYNEATLVVENNSYGLGVLEDIIQAEYPNVYYSKRRDSLSVVNMNTDEEFIDIYSKNAVAGFTTSGKTRPVMIAKMQEDIRNKEIILHSNRVLEELKTFIMLYGKPQASEDAHDDLVMSLGIGMYARNAGVKFNNSIEMQHTLVNSFRQESKSFASVMSTEHEIKDANTGVIRKVPLQHKSAIDTINEFRWLL